MSSVVRKLALLLLCLCTAGHAHADERQSRHAAFHFGALLGAGGADWVGKDADTMSLGQTAVTKSLSAGLLSTMDIGRLMSLDIEPLRLTLQPEIVYTAKGARFERDGQYRGVHASMTYFQAGLLLRTEYAAARRAVPYVVLGPELGFLLSAKLDNGLGDVVDGTDDFKSTDFGLVLGLGAMYALPPWGSLGLEVRADLGLVSIDGQGDGDEIRNAALSLLLVYLY